MSSWELYQKIKNYQKSIFTLNDITLLTGQDKKSATVTANRLVKKGILSKIEREKFCLKNEDVKTIACSIVKPSYISFFFAIYLHGGTTQIPIELQIACLKNRRPVRYEENNITFHKMQVNALTGYNVIKNNDGKQYVLASKEKAIVDSLAYPSLCPFDEVVEAISRFGKEVDFKLCRKYARLLKSKQLEKRLEKAFKYEHRRIAKN